MRRAVEELGDLQRDLDPDSVAPAPQDDISRNFVSNTLVAIRDAQEFFLVWREQLKHAIDAMEQQIKTYENVEEQNRRRYT